MDVCKDWRLGPSLVSTNFNKIFHISHYVESLDVCIEH